MLGKSFIEHKVNLIAFSGGVVGVLLDEHLEEYIPYTLVRLFLARWEKSSS